MSGRLDTLTEINLDDVVGAFGWQNAPVLGAAARRLFRRPARLFAQQMLEFDQAAGLNGLVEAARSALRYHVRDVEVHGASNLPSGGYLALSNHPGLTDTLVLFAALGRRDLRTLALARPFLVSLENVSQQLFYLPEPAAERVRLVRDVARYLRSGGAVLTFPAGRNEPDPENYPGAEQALDSWVESATVFARLAPGTPIVPVCVRGVTWRAAARHPLPQLRRKSDDQQLLASVLQLLCQVLVGIRPVRPTVRIGRPLWMHGPGAKSAADLHAAVLESMRTLVREPSRGQGQGAW